MDIADHRNKAFLVHIMLLEIVFLLSFVPAEAQYAKASYFMDIASDCSIPGVLLIKTGGVVNVNSRLPGSTKSEILSCSLRFKPEDQRAIMDVTFNDFQLSDSGMTLRVSLSGAETYTLSAGSNKPRQMTSEGGTAIITLTRLYLDNNDYFFGIIIQTYKKDDTNIQDQSPVGTGLAVGIVGGIIGFIVLMAIIGICCYRKKKAQFANNPNQDKHKIDLMNDGLSPSNSYGIDNVARNGTSPYRRDINPNEYYDESPRGKKKLLISQGNPLDYRDQSESESETKEPYIMRKYDRSPVKTASLRYEKENSRRGPPQEEGRQQRENSRRENDRREPEKRDNKGNQSQNSPPKSPILTALHSNPRFRASYYAAEEEAEGRARRISGHGDEDEGNVSDGSLTMTWNTTFDTVDDEPKPPAKISKPPTLPPVPKTPEPRVRSEHLINQAHHPSSSSSEAEQPQAGKVKDAEGPPSPSEIVPIRVIDPHSPSIKRKAEMQHTLRPDRSKGKTPETERRRRTADANKPESSGSDTKPAKAGTSKSKPDKPATKTGTNKPAPEYEGRFKKADSARKSKSKSPRIGRSRSTGTFLEDTDSIGRPSGGYRAVPVVTADDYEDSDVESNYNPLRRTGSKGSLYASRSSLYDRGRRRRKNSLGESVYSLAHDDLDYDRHGRDSFQEHRLSRRDRGFRSLGDLEMELRSEQANRSTQTLRECATQTGKGFANVSPGKKRVVKRTKPRSVSSSHTQTTRSKERNLDTSSSSSGISRPRERKNSASSASGIRSKSRERKNSLSSTSGRPKRARSESELKKKVQEAEESHRPGTPKEKPKPRPKPKPRKSNTASVGQLSDEDDLESIRTGMTGPIDQSSVLSAQPVNPAMLGQPVYPPQVYPGYPAGYPPQMAYLHATGQPPVMLPYGHPAGAPMHTGAVAPNHGTAAANPRAVAPGIAPKPASKWDMLCKMTDGESTRAADETGSVAGSVFSNPYGTHQFPPAYSSAVSDYAGSEFSGPSRSAVTQSSTRIPRKSSWSALKEMAEKEYQDSLYAPSESNV